MKNKTAFVVLALISLAILTAASSDPADDIYSPIACVICVVYQALIAVAGFIAGMVFVIAGVKWIYSQADPGERKAAKMAMVAALIGLIIINVADRIVLAVGDEFAYEFEGDCAGICDDGGGGSPPTTCLASCAQQLKIGLCTPNNAACTVLAGGGVNPDPYECAGLNPVCCCWDGP
ncbi:hypothetical protein ACFLRC_03460 [Candidatus Altiarchaeota archaeon]